MFGRVTAPFISSEKGAAALKITVRACSVPVSSAPAPALVPPPGQLGGREPGED